MSLMCRWGNGFWMPFVLALSDLDLEHKLLENITVYSSLSSL